MNTQTGSNHAGAHQPLRVLIVDDSAAFRRAVEMFLRRLPQLEVVGAAEDGEHALRMVASTRPDVVLMDVQMPRLNGLQALRQIRAQFPEVHVIIMTLFDAEELYHASAAAGADRFIPKHRLHDELPGAIAQLFPGRACGLDNG